MKSEEKLSDKPTDSIRELERLVELNASGLLDSPVEESFDQFTRLAATVIGCPLALVSLVDQNRQFFKSCFGLAEPWASSRQTPLTHSFCQHVVQAAELLSVSDARQHPTLKDNLAIAELGVIAYLGVPLTTAAGHTLGSFCVIDSRPRDWEQRDLEILQQLSQLVLERIELRLLARRLHSDYLQLRNLELYRDEMVQMLVHDMRNPLTALMSGLEITQMSGELSDQQREYLGYAKDGSKTLLQLINGILDASKSGTNNLALELVESPADELVSRACRQLVPLAKQSGVRLLWNETRSVLVTADPRQLHRVIVNLVSNAIQHTPSGGLVEVCIAAEDEEMIRFSVTDTGQGIPADAFHHIFEKFVTGEKKRYSSSTGLGLPVSRSVVDAHGGRIWLESTLGKGASFHFTVPGRIVEVKMAESSGALAR